MLCGQSVGSSRGSVLMLERQDQALSCPIKDTSCISTDGHSNVIRTTVDEAENIQECGTLCGQDGQCSHWTFIYNYLSVPEIFNCTLLSSCEERRSYSFP